MDTVVQQEVDQWRVGFDQRSLERIEKFRSYLQRIFPNWIVEVSQTEEQMFCRYIVYHPTLPVFLVFDKSGNFETTFDVCLWSTKEDAVNRFWKDKQVKPIWFIFYLDCVKNSDSFLELQYHVLKRALELNPQLDGYPI